MKNIWELIQNDMFEQAYVEAELELQQTGDNTNFGNKIMALMHLKKYEKVIELEEHAIKLGHSDSSFDFIYAGIAYWLLDKREEAIVLWKKSEQCKYADAAGGIDTRVYEYFAAVKMDDRNLKQHAVKGITKLIKDKRRIINWPGAMGYYLVDEINEEQLLEAVLNTPILRERQMCQAHFVIAIKKLEQGNIVDYWEQLHESIKDGAKAYIEDMYNMAKGELEMMEGAKK